MFDVIIRSTFIKSGAKFEKNTQIKNINEVRIMTDLYWTKIILILHNNNEAMTVKEIANQMGDTLHSRLSCKKDVKD